MVRDIPLQERGNVSEGGIIMANELIGIQVDGLDEIQKKLAALPAEAGDQGVMSANAYILNIEKANARLPYSGEPFVWSSDAQRRKVFALLRAQGGPPYKRSQTLSQGWQTLGYGKNQLVINETPYAAFVKDNSSQIVGHRLRGWKTIQQDVIERMGQIIRHFEAGVSKAIKKLGLE